METYYADYQSSLQNFIETKDKLTNLLEASEFAEELKEDLNIFSDISNKYIEKITSHKIRAVEMCGSLADSSNLQKSLTKTTLAINTELSRFEYICGEGRNTRERFLHSINEMTITEDDKANCLQVVADERNAALEDIKQGLKRINAALELGISADINIAQPCPNISPRGGIKLH